LKPPKTALLIRVICVGTDPRNELTENFIEKAKAADPIALICEGTRMAKSEKRQNTSARIVPNETQFIVNFGQWITIT